jgi:uncharacterized protein YwgA
MSDNPISKRDQHALIALLADHAAGAGQRLGKKALQKSVHLIQELGGVDAGYHFSFYTYGPYSSSLAGDLDVVAAMGGATIAYNASDNYYLIEPGAETGHTIAKGQGFIDRNRAAIDRVLRAFGDRKAKDLELVSTIAYLRRHAPPGEFDSDARLAAHVKALKPKYSENEIATAIGEVKCFLAERRAA